jgi:hypothetical protein
LIQDGGDAAVGVASQTKEGMQFALIRQSVAVAVVSILSLVDAQSLSWCVDTPKLRIGMASISAGRLQDADLKMHDIGSEFRQVYAGEGLTCSWLSRLNIIEPMPNYAFQRELAMAKKTVDIARLSYLKGSIVLDTSIDGKVDHRLLNGTDTLDLGGDLVGTSILHVSLERYGAEVFVKTIRPLSRELGLSIARAVEVHLGVHPWYVNVRNDVYFVGKGYPLRYPFVEGDMPPVEQQKGRVTLKCLNKDGAINCASIWD